MGGVLLQSGRLGHHLWPRVTSPQPWAVGAGSSSSSGCGGADQQHGIGGAAWPASAACRPSSNLGHLVWSLQGAAWPVGAQPGLHGQPHLDGGDGSPVLDKCDGAGGPGAPNHVQGRACGVQHEGRRILRARSLQRRPPNKLQASMARHSKCEQRVQTCFVGWPSYAGEQGWAPCARPACAASPHGQLTDDADHLAPAAAESRRHADPQLMQLVHAACPVHPTQSCSRPLHGQQSATHLGVGGQ